MVRSVDTGQAQGDKAGSVLLLNFPTAGCGGLTRSTNSSHTALGFLRGRSVHLGDGASEGARLFWCSVQISTSIRQNPSLYL